MTSFFWILEFKVPRPHHSWTIHSSKPRNIGDCSSPSSPDAARSRTLYLNVCTRFGCARLDDSLPSKAMMEGFASSKCSTTFSATVEISHLALYTRPNDPLPTKQIISTSSKGGRGGARLSKLSMLLPPPLWGSPDEGVVENPPDGWSGAEGGMLIPPGEMPPPMFGRFCVREAAGEGRDTIDGRSDMVCDCPGKAPHSDAAGVAFNATRPGSPPPSTHHC
mmetsp:Transcript_26996/g.76603  ORF Transcript_26996/g.76603 Transcript_26996/m.76603 type:complete len:221 (-) Transcript_26996:586-1248(-)